MHCSRPGSDRNSCSCSASGSPVETPEYTVQEYPSFRLNKKFDGWVYRQTGQFCPQYWGNSEGLWPLPIRHKWETGANCPALRRWVSAVVRVMWQFICSRSTHTDGVKTKPADPLIRGLGFHLGYSPQTACPHGQGYLFSAVLFQTPSDSGWLC